MVFHDHAAPRSLVLALTFRRFLAKNGQRPPGPAGVVDEGIFEIQSHDVPGKRRERFDHLALVRPEIDDDELETVADFPGLHEPRTAGKCRRPARELEHQLAHAFLEVLGRTVDAQHAVDQDADPIGDALDVGQDMRAEEDRPPLALNEMDHRHQEIAAGDRIQAQRGIVENEQVGIGGDRQGQGDVSTLAVR